MSFNSTDAGGFNETGLGTSQMAIIHSVTIAYSFGLLLSILGIIGNSLVFWFFSFRIKRTKYTVYIINLAIANLIYLISFSIQSCIILIIVTGKGSEIGIKVTFIIGLGVITDLAMIEDMFLLTAISVERCLAVIYPVWYHCNRPKAQSVIACVFFWGLSIMVALVDNLGCPPELFSMVAERCMAILIFLEVLVLLVCTPIMVVSSLILLIRIQKTSGQHQPPKLFIVIIASVIIFLISGAPASFLQLMYYLKVLPSSFPAGAFFLAWSMWVSIHCSINPFIYFLFGRQQMQGAQHYLIRALKKVFREGEEEVAGENGEGTTSDHEM